MNPLSSDDLRMNQEAAGIATSALGEAVVAATRCEQVTSDQKMEAAGVGGLSRGLMKGMKSMNKMMPGVGGVSKGLETGGLPNTFLLAVTATQVHALEDKREPKVLKSWDRDGFQARRGSPQMDAATGVPEDRQVLTLFLPIEGGGNKYLQAAARNTAAAGSPGMPHKVMVAKDAPSQTVVDTLASASAGPNIVIGGTNLQDMMAQAAAAQAAPAVDPTERLSKLADLHARGVLTDEEFATQKAKILSEM
jgi:hypothetical protein